MEGEGRLTVCAPLLSKYELHPADRLIHHTGAGAGGLAESAGGTEGVAGGGILREGRRENVQKRRSEEGGGKEARWEE